MTSRSSRSQLRAALTLSLALSASPLWASVVRPLTPESLLAGADAVVEGRVLSVEGRWNAEHTGLETHVTFRVSARLAGTTPDVLTVVQPGGALDGNRHVVVGMPNFTEGEEARLYLRRLPQRSGPPRFRVYGWSQGKWLPAARDGTSSYEPAPVPPTGVAGARGFATNGMRWPPQLDPVAYQVNRAGSDELGLNDVKQAIADAFATWAAVPCSSLAFEYVGETDLGVAVDQQNVLLFIESGWIYGEEAAGATSLWLPVEGEQTADIALNGEHFSWAIAPTGHVGTEVMDVQGVLTHEMGHFSGLGHTDRAYDTMYFAWKPWPGQRTLSVDDKLGLCSLYPIDGDECTVDGDCPEGGALRGLRARHPVHGCSCAGGYDV